MNLDNVFKTKTVARILIDQGHLKKAAEIYAYLLKQDPEQKDLKSELAAIKGKLSQKNGEAVKDLSRLYRKWIDLEFRYYQMSPKVPKYKI